MKMVLSLVVGGIILCGNAMATVVFEFRADRVFDQAGIGASATQLDADAKTIITLKTVDVIGQNGSRASKGVGHQSFINTGVNALGIITILGTVGYLAWSRRDACGTILPHPTISEAAEMTVTRVVSQASRLLPEAQVICNSGCEK